MKLARGRKILILALLLIIAMCSLFYKELSYGFMQAKGQFKIIKEAQPVSYFLNSPDFPDSLKHKLKILDEIKRYAVDSLSLPAEDQYEKVFDQKGKDVLWVVTAAELFELKSYTWQFPILGEVSYKGFFIYKEAEKEAEKLSNKGFDVRIRPVGAWSTLGWFNDPLMSKLLERSEAKLAEVIFHELIHDVVYIKDSTDFNENLASFLGRKMTLKYLRDTNCSSEEINQYQSNIQDALRLNSFINNQLSFFNELYIGLEGLDDSQKARAKDSAFINLRNQLSMLQFNNPAYADYLIQNDMLNNAHLLAVERYGSIQQKLEQQYFSYFDEDVLKMLAYYATNFNSI